MLYKGYADFYHMPMTIDIVYTIWNWIIDDDNKFYCLIAKTEDGKAVGLMHFREMSSPIRAATVGYLDDLFVDP